MLDLTPLYCATWSRRWRAYAERPHQLDPNGILIQQTENVQAGRQIRFTNVQEIVERAAILKDYIQDAVNVEKSGQEVVFKKNTEFAVAEELQREFDDNPA